MRSSTNSGVVLLALGDAPPLAVGADGMLSDGRETAPTAVFFSGSNAHLHAKKPTRKTAADAHGADPQRICIDGNLSWSVPDSAGFELADKGARFTPIAAVALHWQKRIYGQQQGPFDIYVTFDKRSDRVPVTLLVSVAGGGQVTEEIIQSRTPDEYRRTPPSTGKRYLFTTVENADGEPALSAEKFTPPAADMEHECILSDFLKSHKVKPAVAGDDGTQPTALLVILAACVLVWAGVNLYKKSMLDSIALLEIKTAEAEEAKTEADRQKIVYANAGIHDHVKRLRIRNGDVREAFTRADDLAVSVRHLALSVDSFTWSRGDTLLEIKSGFSNGSAFHQSLVRAISAAAPDCDISASDSIRANDITYSISCGR